VRAAWSSWDQVLSLWIRPAFVLLYLLPAQLGYGAIEAMTALIAALTCFLTYRCARRLGGRPAWLAACLVAWQPLFLALSFSALTEPLAAGLLAGSFMLLLERRNKASALMLAALPLARLELAFLFLPWAVQLARRRAWSAIALAPPQATHIPREPDILALAAAILMIAFVALRPPVMRLTSEQKTMRAVAEWFESRDSDDRVVLCNHIWFNYFVGRSPAHPLARSVREHELANAPEQAIAIWDGHYSQRLGGNGTRDEINRLDGWRVLRRFVGRDQEFYAVALEKLRAAEGTGRLEPGAYVHPP
jgi:uncharacterized membrane protein